MMVFNEFKTSAQFKKAHNYMIHKKELSISGKINVFIDLSKILAISRLSSDVQNEIISESSTENFKGLKRLLPYESYRVVSQYDGYEYFIELDGITHNIYSAITGKLLYSVIEIDSIRWTAYKANIYGVFDGLLVLEYKDKWKPRNGLTTMQDHLI